MVSTNEMPPQMAFTPPLAPPRMSRWRRIFRSLPMRMLLLVAIFVAGSVTGWSVGSVWNQRSQQEKLTEIIKNPRPDWLSDKLKESLQLTDDQYSELKKIIRKHHAALDKIRQEVAPLYVSVFDEMDLEMQGILTDDTQREAWKKKAAGMRMFWASGRPPGRPPGRDREGGRDRDRSRRGGEQRPDDHNREPRPDDRNRERPQVEKTASEKSTSDK
jgi:hypothetical protein